MVHESNGDANRQFGYSSGSASSRHAFSNGSAKASSRSSAEEHPEDKDGITLERYAVENCLPVEFLASIQLKNTNYDFKQAIRMSYPDELGRERYWRHRVALKTEPRFKAPPKHLAPEPIPYGLQVLGDARKTGYALLVEGESDAQICWYNDIPAIGVSGVKAWKSRGEEWAKYLDGIPLLLVPQEQDHGGDDFFRYLRSTKALRDRIYRLPLTIPGAKDIGEVWKQAARAGDEEAFKSTVKGLIDVVKRGAETFCSSPEGGPRGFEQNLLPTVSLKNVMEESADNSEYYAYPLFRAGELTLLVGEAKFSGKTTLAFSALKAVTEGETFLGEETKRAKVLYLSEQGNNLSRVIETSKINTEDEDSFRVVRFRDIWKDPWESIIERGVLTCELEDREILVVDTFNAFSHLKGSEENDAGAVSSRLEPLKIAAQAHNLAVAWIHHSGRDSLIRGSSSFDGTVDTIVVLSRPPGNQGDNLRHITADGRCEPLRLNVELNEHGVYVPVGSSDRVMFTKAVRAIRELAPTKEGDALDWDTFVDLAKKGGTDASKATIERAIRWLVEQETLVETGKGVRGNPHKYWMPERFSPVTEEQQTDGENYSVQTPGVPPSDLNRIIVRDLEGLFEVIENLKGAPEIAFDVETYPQDETARGLDPRRGKVGVITLSYGEKTYVIDRKAFDGELLLDALRSVLSGKPIVAHNAPFDLAFLRRSVGYEHDGPVYDTLVLDAMLFYATGPLAEKENWRGFVKKDKESGYKKPLSNVARDRLGVELDKTEQASDWGGELTEEMISYAAADAAVLLPLKDALLSELDNLGMGKVVDLEARFTPAMAYCSDNGFALDVEGWRSHAAASASALEEARRRCDDLAPEPPEDGWVWSWNASNHRKVGKALELLGAKVEKRPGTGNYETGEAALKAIKRPQKAKEHAEAILSYREHEKYVTTWGDSWFREPEVVSKGKTKGKIKQGSPDHLQIVDGLVYTKMNQLVATGRGSSKSPNLQNLPKDLRGFFVAPSGRKLLVADYSQMEYVAAAHISGDEALLGPLREGVDYHRLTAQMIGVDRDTAKMVNFALLYGMSPMTLATRLGVSKEKAEGYVAAVQSRAPGLGAWCDAQAESATRGTPSTTTPLGRVRMVDQNRHRGAWESNRSQMLNQPIQGGCADGYKIAAAMLWERRSEFAGNPLLVNMIHDEFVLEVDGAAADRDAELLEKIMLEGMEKALGEGIPAGVEVNVANRWTKG
jgi:DNA polymerase-1